MRRTLPLLLVLAASATLATAARAQDSGPLAIGAAAPKSGITMKSVDGSDITIAGAAGKKGTLVIFMCNHCPWVKMWQGRIAALGNAAVEKGIGVIAINPNDPEQYPEDAYDPMVGQAKALGMKFPYAVDATSEVARAFGATRTPEAFLFDAKGKLVYHGTVDDNARDEKSVKQPWLRKAVDAVAAGRSVKPAETKALGCSVKLREPKSS